MTDVVSKMIKTIPEPVCGPGEDFTDLVTVAEIGIVARQLKVDPIGEIEAGGPQRWAAMARLGWVLDRRRDPAAKVETWEGLTLDELLDALAVDKGETPDQAEARRAAAREVDAANPTAAPPG